MIKIILLFQKRCNKDHWVSLFDLVICVHDLINDSSNLIDIMSFQTINPQSGELIASYKYLSGQEIDNKLSKSSEVFTVWKNTSFAQRKVLLLNLAKLVSKKKNSLARLITIEMGKPISESIAELEKCVFLCEYYAEEAEEALRPLDLEAGFQKSYVRFDPIGAVFGIMPWNFPFWQVLRYAVPAIMAGNVALLKHAPNTTGCGLAIQQLFETAAFPKGLFQTLIIDIPQVEQVIAHPVVQGVTLTGSERAGSAVAALAGKYLKKSVMELGGSDPFIVLKDADLEKAAEIGVKSRMLNSGQVCIAAKRFIVDAAIKEKFVNLLKEKIEKLRIGDAFDEKTQLSGMARSDLVETLNHQLRASEEMGARRLLGLAVEGNFFAPDILLDVPEGAPALQEEVFGPIAVVISFNNEAEMINLANSSQYGLGAAIWTKNAKKAEFLAKKIEAGCIAINDMVKSDPRLPFGGMKRSGYGRELSAFGIREFVNIKTVYIAP